MQNRNNKDGNIGPNDRFQDRFRGKFRIIGTERLVLEQVPNYVPKHGFEDVPEGLGAGFER